METDFFTKLGAHAARKGDEMAYFRPSGQIGQFDPVLTGEAAARNFCSKTDLNHGKNKKFGALAFKAAAHGYEDELFTTDFGDEEAMREGEPETPAPAPNTAHTGVPADALGLGAQALAMPAPTREMPAANRDRSVDVLPSVAGLADSAPIVTDAGLDSSLLPSSPVVPSQPVTVPPTAPPAAPPVTPPSVPPVAPTPPEPPPVPPAMPTAVSPAVPPVATTSPAPSVAPTAIPTAEEAQPPRNKLENVSKRYWERQTEGEGRLSEDDLKAARAALQAMYWNRKYFPEG